MLKPSNSKLWVSLSLQFIKLSLSSLYVTMVIKITKRCFICYISYKKVRNEKIKKI